MRQRSCFSKSSGLYVEMALGPWLLNRLIHAVIGETGLCILCLNRVLRPVLPSRLERDSRQCRTGRNRPLVLPAPVELPLCVMFAVTCAVARRMVPVARHQSPAFRSYSSGLHPRSVHTSSVAVRMILVPDRRPIPGVRTAHSSLVVTADTGHDGAGADPVAAGRTGQLYPCITASDN